MISDSTWVGVSLLASMIAAAVVWLRIFKGRAESVSNVLSRYAVACVAAFATFLALLWMLMGLGRLIGVA